MKPIHFAALLAFGAGACVDSPPPIQLFQAILPAPNCNVALNSAGRAGGELNLTVANQATGDNPRGYNIGFRVRSNLQNSEVVVNEQPVTTESDNTIYVNRVELSYRTDREGLSLDGATVPVYSAVEAGDEIGIVANLLTGDALDDLSTGIPVGEQVQVLVTLRLLGETAGGDVESNEVEYPIVVSRPAVGACPPGQYNQELDACEFPGQDGFVPPCVTTP